MSYNVQNFVSGQVLEADHLNHMEAGIQEVEEIVDSLAQAVELLSPGLDGENGATFTPSVSEDGTLSWQNDKGLSNPATVNIHGKDGKDGVDGITPHIGNNKNWWIGDTDTGVSTDLGNFSFYSANDEPMVEMEYVVEFDYGAVTVPSGKELKVGDLIMTPSGRLFSALNNDSLPAAKFVGDAFVGLMNRIKALEQAVNA